MTISATRNAGASTGQQDNRAGTLVPGHAHGNSYASVVAGVGKGQVVPGLELLPQLRGERRAHWVSALKVGVVRGETVPREAMTAEARAAPRVALPAWSRPGLRVFFATRSSPGLHAMDCGLGKRFDSHLRMKSRLRPAHEDQEQGRGDAERQRESGTKLHGASDRRYPMPHTVCSCAASRPSLLRSREM
jgi:hypothetical protein